MKLLHLADLHLGKSLHNLSLTESGDQDYWIDQILAFIAEQRPDAVAIAGDVYDRGVPAREAVPLLSRLLTRIARMEIPVFLTAGNHDGGDRLEFLSELVQDNNVYIAGSVRREMLHVTRDFHDGYGPVTFWLMPYAFPAAVRQALELSEEETPSYTASVRRLLEAQQIDFTQRNVLIAHQTVLCNGSEPEHSLSETAVGGVGGIDAAVFDGFDYVALGHIHGAQKVGGERIRYAGSPLCYHFSEAGQRKGPLMVTLKGKDSLPEAETAELTPLHRVRPTMKGKTEDIIAAEQQSTVRGEYVQVVLTDERVAPNTRDMLTALFESHGCRLVDLGRESEARHTKADDSSGRYSEELPLDELFLRFWRKQTGKDDPEADELELIRFAAAQVGAGLEKTGDELAEALSQFAVKQEVDAE